MSSGNYKLIIDNFSCKDSVEFTLFCTFTPTLTVKAFIQGYYIGFNSMTSVLTNQGLISDSLITDSLTLELHDPNTPYNILYSYKGVINTNGIIYCNLPYSSLGNSYYLVVRHRSAIETWSSNPFTVAATNMYDFTTAANKAYGNNEIDALNENIWSMYNGDLNQDGAIDANDYLLLDIDMQGFASGYYASDLNGDGTVDSSDFLILDANIQGFISSITP